MADLPGLSPGPRVALRADTDALPDPDDPSDTGIVLMTLHSAKGLEFPIVMVAGMGRQRPGGDHVRAAFGTGTDGRRTVELKYGKLSTLGFDSSDDDFTVPVAPTKSSGMGRSIVCVA